MAPDQPQPERLCWLCGQRVTGKPLYSVRGWEEERKQGGANQIIKRKRTGHIAHRDCVMNGPSVSLF